MCKTYNGFFPFYSTSSPIMSKRRSSSPPVNISVTFVAAKNGKSPNIHIHNPVDLSESIGTNSANNFSDLNDVVNDKLYDLWFHKDKGHIYKFDKGAFQAGSIFAIAKKRKDGENEKSKITASCLAPINTPDDFATHVKTVADSVCKRATKTTTKTQRSKNTTSTQKRVISYHVQLCVALVKEKVAKQRKSTA